MADHRHKRDTNARTFRRPSGVVLAGPLAVLATTGAVGLGLLASGGHADLAADASSTSGSSLAAQPAAAPAPDVPSTASLEQDERRTANVPDALRPVTLSRSASRVDTLTEAAAVDAAIDKAHTKRWTTTALNLWTSPADDAEKTGEIAAAKQVLLTGRSLMGRDEIVVGKHETRWVTSGYFSDEKPLAAAAGLSHEPCPDPSVENGLTTNAVYVYRSVCHAFPQITTYGGYDPHGEHASGKALDIMTSDPALLTAIANFLQAHASELHLYDIIRMQHIWTPVRASEGWRLMPDRGSATANHYDHVHVSTY